MLAANVEKPQLINISYTNITSMETVVAKARKWGNSIGVILPKDVVEKVGIRDGSEVELLVGKKEKNILRELFGSMKGKSKDKRPLAEFMKEVDKELYND